MNKLILPAGIAVTMAAAIIGETQHSAASYAGNASYFLACLSAFFFWLGATLIDKKDLAKPLNWAGKLTYTLVTILILILAATGKTFLAVALASGVVVLALRAAEAKAEAKKVSPNGQKEPAK